MPKVTAIADLSDLTPGAVFVATNAPIYLGYDKIEGEIVIAETGTRAIAAITVTDDRVMDDVRRGQLSAKCSVRMRGGVGTVTDISLIRGDGNAAWFHGQHRDDLSAECRYWKPRIALARMAASTRPALTIPTGARPPGHSVCSLTVEGEIDWSAALTFENSVKAAKGKTISVSFDSSGGELAAGWRMYTALAEHDALVVTNASRAFSAAMLPFLAGDVRTMQSDANLMVHRPVLSDLTDNAGSDDLRQHADMLDGEEGRVAALIAARTGNDLSIVSEWVKQETYLNAGQALALGFVGQVLNDQAPRIPVARRARFAPINGPFSSARARA